MRDLCHSNAQAKTVVKALIHTSLDSTPSYTTTTCYSILRYNDKQLAGKKAHSKDLIISSVLTYINAKLRCTFFEGIRSSSSVWSSVQVP